MTANRLIYTASVLLVCLLLVTSGAVLIHTYRQRAIVQSLLKFEGTVYALYGDYQYTPPATVAVDGGLSLVLGAGQRVHGFSVRDEPSRFQRLLVSIFGEHACAKVSAVYWDTEPVSDNDLQLLDGIPQLRELHVGGTSVTDGGLVQIARLRHLTVLDLSSTRVTSSGIRQLAACTELRELDLSGTDVDEPDVERLKQAIPHCEIKR
ncbi:MAG: hypothetical protein L0211_08560 [Planctomycetaceae bacterium]|nr:hypothetical protein [Planctomycetaceae bacterium]